MSTRFPPSNLPDTMRPYGRALENSLTITADAQRNASNIVASMRQSVASNYGLGDRLTNNVGSLSNKVYTEIKDHQVSPAAAVTFSRAWNNVGTAVTLTSPAFVSNVALSVAGTAWLDITGGVGGGVYSHWLRIAVSGTLTGNRILPRNNFGQVLFYWDEVPASTVLTLRMQVWGIIYNPDNSVSNGLIGTPSIIRMAPALRAIALV